VSAATPTEEVPNRILTLKGSDLYGSFDPFTVTECSSGIQTHALSDFQIHLQLFVFCFLIVAEDSSRRPLGDFEEKKLYFKGLRNKLAPG
jgi:hypothetical protein